MSHAHPLTASPWGGIIAAYLILVGVTAGISLLCWWIRPRDPRSADVFEWWSGWVSFLALSVASLILLFDLAQPQRFFLMLTEFSNLGSPMAVGAKLIALKTFLLFVYLYLIHRRRQARAQGDEVLAPGLTEWTYQAAPALLGVVSFALAVYPATLLARTWISPLATSPAASVIFLGTALLMGSAVSDLLASSVPGIGDEQFRERVRRMLVFLVCLQGILLVMEGLALHGNPAHLERVFRDVVFGSHASTLWGLVVGVGLALPLAGLLFFPRSRSVSVASALGVLIGAAATRWLMFDLR